MAEPLILDRLVRELKNHVQWPQLGAHERIDVRLVNYRFVREADDEPVIAACRYNVDDPLKYHREVYEAVPGEEIRRLAYTGHKGRFVEVVHGILKRLSLILGGKPPKGWRLFNRPAIGPVFWSRLRTRPVNCG